MAYSNPPITAKACCCNMVSSIPVEEINSYISPTHEKWQRFHKMVFVSSEDDNFVHCYLTDETDAMTTSVKGSER